MKVQILVRQSTIPARLEPVIHTLCDAVESKYEGIWNICVVTEDVNGAQNTNTEQRCHLKVRGSHRLAIELDRTDQDLSQAVDKAFWRLGQILARIRPHRSPIKETGTGSLTKRMSLHRGARHESGRHSYSVDWEC